jgi:hypothetical protein
MQSQTPQTVKFAAFKAEIEQSLGTVDLIEYNESILPLAEERRKFMFLYIALMLRQEKQGCRIWDSLREQSESFDRTEQSDKI